MHTTILDTFYSTSYFFKNCYLEEVYLINFVNFLSVKITTKNLKVEEEIEKNLFYTFSNVLIKEIKLKKFFSRAKKTKQMSVSCYEIS